MGNASTPEVGGSVAADTPAARSFAETYTMRSTFWRLLGEAGKTLAEAYTQADRENQTAIKELAFDALIHSLVEHHRYGADVLAATEQERQAAHRRHGLSVEIVDGRLVIAIGVDSLITAVRGGDFWDDDELAIVSADVLAADIVSELERELDDGTTPVHLMIDAAAEEAVNQGSLGVEAKADAEIVYDRDGPR